MFHINTRIFSQASPFRSSFSPRLIPKAWDLESPHLLSGLQSMFELYTEALGLSQQPWRTCFPLSMLHASSLKTQFLQQTSFAGFERAGYRSHRLMFESNRCTYLVIKQSPCLVEWHTGIGSMRAKRKNVCEVCRARKLAVSSIGRLMTLCEHRATR
jgi:hypothetical protein